MSSSRRLVADLEQREWTFVRKDGKTLTANLVVTASHDADGKITGFLGVAIDVTARQQAEGDGLALSYSDITERKEAENKLQTLARRLGLATRVLQAGVWDWDLRTENILWDEKMYEIYGLPQNLPITYQIWANAVLPEDLAKVEAIMQNVISSKSQDSWEFRITLPNGSLRYIQSAAGTVTDDTGQVITWSGSISIPLSAKKAKRRFD